MASKTRVAIGRIVLVVFFLVYIAVAMVIGATFFPQRHPVIQLAYFAVAGLLWVIPAMWIITWSRGPTR